MIAAAHDLVMVVAENFCFLGKEEEGGGDTSHSSRGHSRGGRGSRGRGWGGPRGRG